MLMKPNGNKWKPNYKLNDKLIDKRMTPNDN